MKVKLSSVQIWALEMMTNKGYSIGKFKGQSPYIFLRRGGSRRFSSNTLASLIKLKIIQYLPKHKDEYRARGYSRYVVNPKINLAKTFKGF